MKCVQMTAIGVAMITWLTVTPGYAQATPPPQNPPAQPPATAQQPPAAPQPQPQAPAPFPAGAKVGYIFMQGIFNGSAEGKAAAAKVQEWEKKTVAAIEAKVKEAEALQKKLQEGASVINDASRSQSERELQRLQRDIQAMREDAQVESQELRQRLLDEFSKKVNPVLAEVAKERGLHMVFSVGDGANVAWADPGLDLTADVIKRLDAATTKK